MSRQATANRIRAVGSRITRQRLLVAEALEVAGRQMTAQELWEQLRHREQRIGRATVFRTLEALVSAGVARRLEREGHVYGYVACDPAHHHHLACTVCGRVEEISESFVAPMAARISAERGFELDDARLDLYGRCADCARRTASA